MKRLLSQAMENSFYAAAFLMAMSAGINFFAVPLYAIELGASAFLLGLIGSAFPLLYSPLSFITGRASDRWGRRGIIIVGCVIQVITLLLMAFSSKAHHLLVLNLFSGVAMAMFWPPLQAWIADSGSGDSLKSGLGAFNLSWSLGFMLGPLIGGVLYESGPRVPFFLSAAVTALGPLFVGHARVGRGGEYEAHPEPEGSLGRDVVVLITICWIGNFTSRFVAGSVQTLFPKLGVELLFSPMTIGVLMFLLGLSQALIFALIRGRKSWRFSMASVLSFQALAAIAMMTILFLEAPAHFAVIFSCVGAYNGVMFYSSIYYSLQEQKERGRRSGAHEAFGAAGRLFGPFLGGLVAKYYGLRSPYVLCFCVILLAVLWQGFLLRGLRTAPQAERVTGAGSGG